MDKPYIGVDESGKGDYFGYLVVAGVIVEDDAMEAALRRMGVKDSKKLLDQKAVEMARKIKKACKYEIVEISPEKYNQLYGKFGRNLNKLLAWGHARVIENLLEKNGCELVITDKFGDEKFVKAALMERGKKVKLLQQVRAESHTAVATASVLARAEFLKTLKKLSLEVGYKLPKGATHVEDAAKSVIEKHGSGILPMIAKMHFKITKKILS